MNEKSANHVLDIFCKYVCKSIISILPDDIVYILNNKRYKLFYLIYNVFEEMFLKSLK